MTIERFALFIMLGAGLASPWPARAAIASGVYQTLPGATVEERGDVVPGGSRFIPISATLTIDASAAQPSLKALIPNAVLEGVNPFPLTVTNSYGSILPDGSLLFRGDYLGEISATPSQYLFDWRISKTAGGQLVWNGITGWSGGRYWQYTLSNLPLLPAPHLNIVRQGPASVEISWPTTFPDHVLEYADSLPAADWNDVTNDVARDGVRFSVMLDTDASQRFYRLRMR